MNGTTHAARKLEVLPGAKQNYILTAKALIPSSWVSPFFSVTSDNDLSLLALYLLV